jgi:putative endonuclease
MAYTVYILRTSSNTFYTGQTNNLKKRLKQHKDKTKNSAKYMRSFKSFKLVYKETYPTLSKALKREFAIKKLSHAEKEALVTVQIKTTVKLLI